jgi:hypothetical protein
VLQHRIHMEGLLLFLGLNPLAKLLVRIAHLWQALQTEYQHQQDGPCALQTATQQI